MIKKLTVRVLDILFLLTMLIMILGAAPGFILAALISHLGTNLSNDDNEPKISILFMEFISSLWE